MPELTFPLQLSPVFKPKIWGRKDLGPVFKGRGGPSPVGFVKGMAVRPGSGPACRIPPPPGAGRPQAGAELIGEVWITDDTSTFLNGPVAGLTLGEVSRNYGARLYGSSWRGQGFPLLAKYLFTSDWLSIQVHPDDVLAARFNPGNFGKCEMWYVVQADRKAEILLGLRRGVDREAFRAACQKGTSKALLNRFHPKAGEAIYVPPGTAHGLGPGLVIFEVEQNSDLTYRLDDFGRTGLDGKLRPLHLGQGLEAVRAELPPRRNLPQVQLRESFGSRRLVLACRCFALEELRLRRAATFHGRSDRVEILSALSGAGRIETAAGWFGYRCGSTWLVPPAAAPFRIVPLQETRWLKFYVPDIERDFRRPLVGRRVRPSRIREVVFD